MRDGLGLLFSHVQASDNASSAADMFQARASTIFRRVSVATVPVLTSCKLSGCLNGPQLLQLP